jgi:hypothetical protein
LEWDITVDELIAAKESIMIMDRLVCGAVKKLSAHTVLERLPLASLNLGTTLQGSPKK